MNVRTSVTSDQVNRIVLVSQGKRQVTLHSVVKSGGKKAGQTTAGRKRRHPTKAEDSDGSSGSHGNENDEDFCLPSKKKRQAVKTASSGPQNRKRASRKPVKGKVSKTLLV